MSGAYEDLLVRSIGGAYGGKMSYLGASIPTSNLSLKVELATDSHKESNTSYQIN